MGKVGGGGNTTGEDSGILPENPCICYLPEHQYNLYNHARYCFIIVCFIISLKQNWIHGRFSV